MMEPAQTLDLQVWQLVTPVDADTNLNLQFLLEASLCTLYGSKCRRT